MIMWNLTDLCGAATGLSMTDRLNSWRTAGRAGLMGAGAIALCGPLAGCINVAAPDKPIVIELNINIRQEVVFALAEDAANTLEENADIF